MSLAAGSPSTAREYVQRIKGEDAAHPERRVLTSQQGGGIVRVLQLLLIILFLLQTPLAFKERLQVLFGQPVPRGWTLP